MEGRERFGNGRVKGERRRRRCGECEIRSGRGEVMKGEERGRDPKGWFISQCPKS